MVDVLSLVIIAVIIVIILYLRPSTVTDVAHSLGRAGAEFRRGQQESSAESDPPSEDLKRLAQQLGIEVQGKSAKQLSDLIVEKTHAGK